MNSDKYQERQLLKPEELARYFYKFPLNGFPILDDAYNFSGLLLRRYILNNMSEFKASKATIRNIIEKYIYYPTEGEIVRMIFGDKKIQEFPVLNRQGFVMGVWELSSFFRIFDKVPFSAFLNFRTIFDHLPDAVFITDDKGKLMTFNRAMVHLTGLEQDDSRNIGRRLPRILTDLAWDMESIDDLSGTFSTPSGTLCYDKSVIRLENQQLLFLYMIRQDNRVPSAKATTRRALALNDAVEQLEKEMVSQALNDCMGNISQASIMLNIPRQTLQYKIAKYGVKTS